MDKPEHTAPKAEKGHGHGKISKHYDSFAHIPGYAGCTSSDGKESEHLFHEFAAGFSTMEHCPDEHEDTPPSHQQEDTAGELLHLHGHPDHVLEFENDRSNVGSDGSDSDHFENSNPSDHLDKGRTVIRGGKLIHLPDEVEDCPQSNGIASLVHPDADAGGDTAKTHGCSKASGHGRRFRGEKIINVAAEEEDKLAAAGIRHGELN